MRRLFLPSQISLSRISIRTVLLILLAVLGGSGLVASLYKTSDSLRDYRESRILAEHGRIAVQPADKTTGRVLEQAANLGAAGESDARARLLVHLAWTIAQLLLLLFSFWYVVRHVGAPLDRVGRELRRLGALPAGQENHNEIERLKASAHALERSLVLLAEAQRLAHVGSWEYDVGSDTHKWSDELFRIYEIDPQKEGATYNGRMSVTHPDDRAAIERAHDDSLEKGEPYEAEYRLLMADGRIKYVHERGEPICGADGVLLRSLGVLQDITERKAAEQQLKEALELTEGVINAIPDLLFEVDRDGRYLNVWARNPELLAAQKEVLLGRTVHEVLSPENAGYAMEAIREADEKGIACGKDICIELPHGKFWFSHTLAKKPGSTPSDTSFIVLSRDITERKQAERQLKEALEFSEGIINAIPDLLFEMDSNGRYLNVWTHTPELLAAQQEILLGKTVRDVLSPDSAAVVMDAIRDAEKNNLSFGKVIRIDLPIGPSWFELSVSRKPGGQSSDARFLMLSRDVTERKYMEAELMSSRNFLESVIDSLPDPIFVKDRQHRWILLNEANCQFTGMPREALIGKSDYDVFPREEADVFWAKDELVFDSGEVNLNEESFTSANGEEHFIQTKKTSFISADGSQMLVGVIRDITERKRYETAREAALAEAERLAKLRSEFIAHMSHELRTPLNGILGYAQMLGRDAGLDEKQHASVDVIRQSGEHLLALIDDILDLARIESGKLELDIGDIPLIRFLNFVAEVVGIKARQKGLELLCEFADDLPEGIRGDEKRLRQVLLNLLSNAVKFTDQGQVILSVKRAGRSRLAFAVRDTGIGIAPADREAIFQSFEQASDALHRLGGSGLGLAISRQLVRLMRGEIEVESRVGLGSTFRFELELPEVKIEPVALRLAPAEMPRVALDDETSEPLVIPPTREMQELHRLALQGNMRDIVHYADRIAPNYQPFAAHLRQLANGFQSKAILAFVEEHLLHDTAD